LKSDNRALPTIESSVVPFRKVWRLDEGESRIRTKDGDKRSTSRLRVSAGFAYRPQSPVGASDLPLDKLIFLLLSPSLLHAGRSGTNRLAGAGEGNYMHGNALSSISENLWNTLSAADPLPSCRMPEAHTEEQR
jgi:hypothetical protein